MGDVYQSANHAFVADANLWKINCREHRGVRHAQRAHRVGDHHRLVQLALHAGRPGSRQHAAGGFDSPVTFIPPTETPGQPLLTDTMTLNYVDGETASGEEARTFIYRNDRIIEQGKPIAGGNQLALTGPEAGGSASTTSTTSPRPEQARVRVTSSAARCSASDAT
ncbi:MAG: hypothetical protein R2838_00195 [Caldilineaceae bacterium]